MSNPGYVAPDTVVESAWGNDVVSRLVPIYTDAAARTSAMPAPDVGQVTYLTDTNTLEIYDGSWHPLLRATVDTILGQLVIAEEVNILFEYLAGTGFNLRADPSGDLIVRRGNTEWLRFRQSGGVEGTETNKPILLHDGSEAAPSLTFAADRDTGIARGGANLLELIAGGSVQLDVGGTWVRSAAIRDQTTTSAANVFVAGTTNRLLRSTSSARAKSDVSEFPATYAHDLIDQLRSVLYRSELAGDDRDSMRGGFIAEEVGAEFPQATVDDDDNYDVRALVAALWSEVRDLRHRVAVLEGR